MSDTKECCVCYEATEHLTPCNHPVCESCYPRLNICPMCRAPLGPTDDSDIDEVNCILYNAAGAGDERLVRQMLDRGANNFNWAMAYAARNGHLSIVQLMLDQGANDYNRAIFDTARNGHLSIVELITEKGTKTILLL